MKRYLIYSLLIILISSCLKEDVSKKPFVSYIPKDINDGWEISTPENEKIDPKKLALIYEDFHKREDMWQARSLLVIRNGKLVAESYTKDDRDRTTPRLIQSCTKQVLGLLTGIAVEKRIISDINDPISKYIPETNTYSDKKDITIKQLLTMSSGINFENNGIAGQNFDLFREKPDKIVDYILDRPLANRPGEIALYKDCDPHLVSVCIQNQVGKKTSEWAKEILFDPLGIQNLYWLAYKDGYTLGGYGIYTTPRDLAKFGQLVLNNGMHNGKQIVSEQWIKDMTTVRAYNVYGTEFGYLWRLDSYNKRIMMMGHGGQLVCIQPTKNLIVVITAEVNTQGDYELPFSSNWDFVDRIMSICN
jgi:CubicO group peptidase (beta-lactamase class C family)